MTPWDISTMAMTRDSGRRRYSVHRTMSAQKLPMVGEFFRAMLRMKAMAMQMPVAAERKFCTARPTIWVR